MKKSNKAARKRSKQRIPEIRDYDHTDTSAAVDSTQPLKFEDIGVQLPETPPTQVISIRLPSPLLNELRALSSQRDIPYQALIKLFLSEAVARFKKRSVA